ncbi:hypothetical protein ACFO0S_13910 [Chryseomicrobium palamuruense]|uniref:Type II secretion system protein n=1 Tax=Chryseomicrobium palamuruense TaxID=682973 RepID=A0ABV8UXT6_9BACL
MNMKGYSTVESLAAFGAFISMAMILTPLLTGLLSTHQKALDNYSFALAEYELIKRLPSSGEIVVLNTRYWSTYDGSEFCVHTPTRDARCRD